jgi:hypothetical protein
MSFVTDLYVEGGGTNLTVCQILFCKAVGHLHFHLQNLLYHLAGKGDVS